MIHCDAGIGYPVDVWVCRIVVVAVATCIWYFVYLKGIAVAAVDESDPGRNGALSHDGKAGGNGADTERISVAIVTAELVAKVPAVAATLTGVGVEPGMRAAVACARLLPPS